MIGLVAEIVFWGGGSFVSAFISFLLRLKLCGIEFELMLCVFITGIL